MTALQWVSCHQKYSSRMWMFALQRHCGQVWFHDVWDPLQLLEAMIHSCLFHLGFNETKTGHSSTVSNQQFCWPNFQKEVVSKGLGVPMRQCRSNRGDISYSSLYYPFIKIHVSSQALRVEKTFIYFPYLSHIIVGFIGMYARYNNIIWSIFSPSTLPFLPLLSPPGPFPLHY